MSSGMLKSRRVAGSMVGVVVPAPEVPRSVVVVVSANQEVHLMLKMLGEFTKPLPISLCFHA